MLLLWLLHNAVGLVGILLIARFVVYCLTTVVTHPIVADIIDLIAQELLVTLQHVVYITRHLVNLWPYLVWIVRRLVWITLRIAYRLSSLWLKSVQPRILTMASPRTHRLSSLWLKSVQPASASDDLPARCALSSMREMFMSAGLPPKVVTKCLMELVVPKEPLEIQVGISWREEQRQRICEASWESPTPLLRIKVGTAKKGPVSPLALRPIAPRPVTPTASRPASPPPPYETDEDDESEVEDLVPQTPKAQRSNARAGLREGIETPECYRTPKTFQPQALPFGKVIFVVKLEKDGDDGKNSIEEDEEMEDGIEDDEAGRYWRCHPSGDIIMGREPRTWAPFGWDGPDGDIVMG